MTFEDSLEGLERWAKLNKTDAELSGKYPDADFYALVVQVIDLARTQRRLATRLEQTLREKEIEIARLESLAARA